MRAVARLQADHAPFVSDRDRFSPTDSIQLGQNGLHMRLGGAFGDGEATGDVLVASSLSNQLQHIQLSLCEAGFCHSLQGFGCDRG